MHEGGNATRNVGQRETSDRKVLGGPDNLSEQKFNFLESRNPRERASARARTGKENTARAVTRARVTRGNLATIT